MWHQVSNLMRIPAIELKQNLNVWIFYNMLHMVVYGLDYPRRALIGQLDVDDYGDEQDRAKTAPGKVQRKNWMQVMLFKNL